jgi:hypothetical protein
MDWERRSIEPIKKERSKGKRIDHNGSLASTKELITGNWMSFGVDGQAELNIAVYRFQIQSNTCTCSVNQFF